MEKLHDKIEGIISDHSGIISTNYDGMRDTIAQEVKDIAIAFALHLSAYAPTKNPQLLDDIFTNFIQTYYK